MKAYAHKNNKERFIRLQSVFPYQKITVERKIRLTKAFIKFMKMLVAYLVETCFSTSKTAYLVRAS